MNIAAKLLKEKETLLNVLELNNHKPNIQTDDCHDCHDLQQHIDHKHELEDPSYKPVEYIEPKPPDPPPVFTQNEKPSNIEEKPIEDDISESENTQTQEDNIIQPPQEDPEVIETPQEDPVEIPSENNIQQDESEDDIMFL